MRRLHVRKGSEVKLGREHFSNKPLNNARIQKSPLLCDKCKERERIMFDKTRTVDGNGKCSCSSTWRPTTTCFFLRRNKVRLSRADFKWLLFREQNPVPRVQEITYYAEVGLLEECNGDAK